MTATEQEIKWYRAGQKHDAFGEALKKETDVFCQENASCEDPVPLLRHILYVRNVPSEHAGMGSNTL